MKYTKAFRALITVRNWVTATLGHSSSRGGAHYIYVIPAYELVRSNVLTHSQEAIGAVDSPFDSTQQRNVIDTLQQSMAKITILKANILRTATSFTSLSTTTLIQMKNDLEQWLAELPKYMQLEALVKHPEITPDQRRVTFYMHLFHMSAIMLKARAVLADQEAQGHTYEDLEVRTAIADGVDTAQNSARLLGLIYDEGSVVKNCWLTM
jgi:hypothetical protein